MYNDQLMLFVFFAGFIGGPILFGLLCAAIARTSNKFRSVITQLYRALNDYHTYGKSPALPMCLESFLDEYLKFRSGGTEEEEDD